jgi:hypothetical protein
MKRTWVYPSDGSEAYEVTRGEYRNESMASVMGDMAPFMSPDGVMIEGRKQWREHLKRTDSIEMGHSDVKYAQQEWNRKKKRTETGCVVSWLRCKSLTDQAHR